jgi:hypothetical protein
VPSLNYTPSPTLGLFMSSTARVRIVRGPVGSGKSTAMVMELLRRACEQAPDSDGVRRTKAAIVRNTLSQLETTSLITVMKTLRGIAHYKSGDSTIQIRAPGIESDWILMPLDRPENVQRLLSLELTFAWMSELRELDPVLLQDLLGRLGRYPAPIAGGAECTWYGIIGETNSFSEDSPWFKLLEEQDLPKGWDYFVQPGARSPNAEIPPGLPSTYYPDLIENNTKEWVEQYIDNLVTPSLSGEAVFRSTFRHDFHVAEQELRAIPGTMLVVGQDFGRTPTSIITQMDPRGRILVLDEVIGTNSGIEKFLAEQLRPALVTRYLSHAVGIVGDPAGNAKGQIGEESVFDVIKRYGYAAQPAQTNLIEPRLRAVEKWFLQQRDGKAAILISPRCKMLIRALGARYRYARKKDGELQPAPEKLHPWSDLGDALQYAVLGHSGRIVGKFVRVNPASAPTPPTGGWT